MIQKRRDQRENPLQRRFEKRVEEFSRKYFMQIQ